MCFHLRKKLELQTPILCCLRKSPLLGPKWTHVGSNEWKIHQCSAVKICLASSYFYVFLFLSHSHFPFIYFSALTFDYVEFFVLQVILFYIFFVYICMQFYTICTYKDPSWCVTHWWSYLQPHKQSFHTLTTQYFHILD